MLKYCEKAAEGDCAPSIRVLRRDGGNTRLLCAEEDDEGASVVVTFGNFLHAGGPDRLQARLS